MKRYALVHYRETSGLDMAATGYLVDRYLPSNYKVEGLTALGIVIGGEDYHGWTLDDYVIPRLGSGLMRAEEIDLSHPAALELKALVEAKLKSESPADPPANPQPD